VAAAAHEAQLRWEARWGKPAAAAALVSAALLVGGTILRQVVALESRPDNEAEFLAAINKESSAFLSSAVLQSLSFLLLGAVLYYLYRATKYRRPELPAISLYLALLGPVLLAIAGVLSDIDRIDIADKFVDSSDRTAQVVGSLDAGQRAKLRGSDVEVRRTEKGFVVRGDDETTRTKRRARAVDVAEERRAEDLLGDASVASAALGSGGTLAIAISLVMINLNAMRVGLLSRFMGIIGIIIGVLYVLPVFAGPLVVELFWLLALAALFWGYWPNGRPEAWEVGEAVPWPSAAQMRGEVPEPQPDEEAEAAPGEPKRPASRKRKKKR
jgi:hypothetical protein